MLVVRELDCKFTQRPIGRAQVSLAPVAGDGVHECVRLFRVLKQLLDLFPEVVRMRLYSVAALEFRRDHCGE